jgi:endonuclease-8
VTVPEGHVSHRNARDLRATLVGERLTVVEVAHPMLEPKRLRERLEGDLVTAAEARGKHHLLMTEAGRTLISHLKMSGRWRIQPAARPARRGGLFLRLVGERYQALLYRCPTVQLLEPWEPIPPAIARLGPDLLAEGVEGGPTALAAFAGVDPDRAVGEVLLDQRVMAGIGNAYKNETCFLAGVDPWRAIADLTREERHALGEIAADLLAAGVEQGGRIGTYSPPGVSARARIGTTWVHGRANRPCRACGSRIRARGQGEDNRTTFWCPTCQS